MEIKFGHSGVLLPDQLDQQVMLQDHVELFNCQVDMESFSKKQWSTALKFPAFPDAGPEPLILQYTPVMSGEFRNLLAV